MPTQPHYLKLTTEQLDLLKFVVELKIHTLLKTEDEVLLNFRAQLDEIREVLQEQSQWR